MIHHLSTINWLAVALAFFAYFILGGLWFTTFFKKSYHRSLGKTIVPNEKPAAIFIVGPALCSLVITITSAVLMYALGINTFSAAMEFALIIGIGYLLANTVNIAINPNIPHPIHYSAISGVFHLVGIIIVCSILQALS